MANSHSPFGVPQTGARQRAGREAPRSPRQPYEPEPADDHTRFDPPSREQRALPRVGASGHTGSLGAVVPDESPQKDGEPGRPRRTPRQRSEGVTQPLRRAQAKARKRRQWWMATLVTTVGIAVLAACSVGTWMILTETEPDLVPGAKQPVSPSEDEVDEPAEAEEPVSSRGDNPDPLTVDELFPTEELTHEDADTEYHVLVSEELDDCPEATFDGVADALADLDCNQVVRATVVDENETYVATVGVMNLIDDAESAELREVVEDDNIDGGFTALRDDEVGADLGRTLTVLGHNTYGHYFLYAVVGQVDGEEPDSEDELLRAVVDDVVDGWLIDTLSARNEQQ